MTNKNSNTEDLMSVNPDDVTDITKLRIDSSKSVVERRRQYLKQVGNPYLVRVGDTIVRVSFAENGVSFEEAFENMLTMS